LSEIWDLVNELDVRISQSEPITQFLSLPDGNIGVHIQGEDIGFIGIFNIDEKEYTHYYEISVKIDTISILKIKDSWTLFASSSADFIILDLTESEEYVVTGNKGVFRKVQNGPKVLKITQEKNYISPVLYWLRDSLMLVWYPIESSDKNSQSKYYIWDFKTEKTLFEYTSSFTESSYAEIEYLTHNYCLLRGEESKSYLINRNNGRVERVFDYDVIILPPLESQKVFLRCLLESELQDLTSDPVKVIMNYIG
jgi:hypothetical protein